MRSSLLLASNRGPLSFRFDDRGVPRGERGAGGLVSALAGLAGPDAVWVCAALSEADRRAAAEAAGRVAPGVRLLAIDPAVFDHAYNDVANRVLWFVNHLLYATATRPVFDAAFRAQWADFETYNARFADALAEEAAPGARVLVQDYHLCLVPEMLRARRADLRIAHFSHTPWAPPDYFALLPDDVAARILTGVLGADHAGFLSARWAGAFLACCRRVLGVSPGPAAAGSSGELAGVEQAGRRTTIAVHPLGVDAAELTARAAQPDVSSRREALSRHLAGRRALVRVDRTELSKNILRGLAAYRELLATRPEWQGRVVHLAFAYPSRHDLPEYREYTAAVEQAASEINAAFSAPGWEPVRLEVEDDYARSLAALTIADVLVANPVRDGMNLVAKEGPVLSADGLALVLSREAGAAAELGADAFLVNPFDVTATAAAMDAALRLDAGERAARCGRLAAAATAHPPASWLADQLAALA